MSEENELQRENDPALNDDQKKIQKNEKRLKEKENLQLKIQSGALDTMLSKVAYILNMYPDTRNSDITRQLKYWEEFHGYKKGEKLEPGNIYEYERLTSIARARAKVVNEYGLYSPTVEKIKRYRQTKEEIEKEQALASKPSVPSIYIYADESGKTGGEAFAIVGSLWIPDTNRTRELNYFLKKWSNEKNEEGVRIPKEFHFTEMKRQQLEIYMEFFNTVLSQADVFSFKVVAANKSKIRGKSLDDTIFSLYYQLGHIGIEHEVKTGRVVLPRDIFYYKDEEVGTDDLRMTELKQLQKNDLNPILMRG